jgi:predicted DNA-binding ribbon-helix-helix protein
VLRKIAKQDKFPIQNLIEDLKQTHLEQDGNSNTESSTN